MRRVLPAVVIIVLGFALGVGWRMSAEVAVPLAETVAPEPVEPRSPAVAPPVAAVNVPAPVLVAPSAPEVEDHAVERGPNGMPIEDEGHARKIEGLPDRPVETPPADAATWDARRSTATAAWAERMRVDTADWLASQGVDEPVRLGVSASMRRFTTEVAGVKQGIQGGELTPAEGRERLRTARTLVATEMETVLGPDADRLRRHLAEQSIDGGW